MHAARTSEVNPSQTAQQEQLMRLATADRRLDAAMVNCHADDLKMAIISTVKAIAGLDPAFISLSEASVSLASHVHNPSGCMKRPDLLTGFSLL